MRPIITAVTAVAVVTALAACSAPPDAPAPPPEDTVVVRDDLGAVFARHGLTGTFVLRDATTGTTTVVGRDRAETPMPPQSTFKLAHTLIALETGVVTDPDRQVLPYGGGDQPVDDWERDMTLREAVTESNAALFGQLALRIGPEREREWLDRLGYGDREIGARVDRFWLDGPLDISAVEQTRWIERLAERTLPASRSAQDTVADLVRVESGPAGTLYAKTGWRFDSDPQLGWWVGWAQTPAGVHTFALNVDMRGADDAALRAPIGRELLAQLGVLPAP